MSPVVELIRDGGTIVAASVEGFHVRIAIRVGQNGPVIDLSLSADTAAAWSEQLRALAIEAMERRVLSLRDRAERLEQAAEDANARRG